MYDRTRRQSGWLGIKFYSQKERQKARITKKMEEKGQVAGSRGREPTFNKSFIEDDKVILANKDEDTNWWFEN